MHRVFSSDTSLRFSPLIFLILLALLLTSPLWQQAGIPNTADAHHHLPRSAAVERSFEQGVFWPRWFPNSNYGLGEPTFHYYSPGLYWLVGAVHWTGIGLDQALTLVVTVAFILSGFGAYGWLRHTFSRNASLACTAIFLGMPHIYSRTFLQTGDYPQLLGFLIFPIILWAFTALFFRDHLGFWLAAVLSLAGLVLSHQQQALIGTGTLLAYLFFLAAVYRKWDGLARCTGAALIAALISAAYWLPALGDLPLVQIQGELHEREFRGIDFLSWVMLLSLQPFVWDFRAGNPLAGPHNSFGFTQWLTGVAGLAVTLAWPGDRKKLLWCIAGILFTLTVLLITTPPAIALWENFSGLAIIQYPFRLLPVAVLGVLPAAAALVDVFPERLRLYSSSAVILAAIVFPFPYLFPKLATHTSIVSTESLTAEQVPGRNPGVWHFLPRDLDWNSIIGYRPEREPVNLTWSSPHEAVANVSGQSEPIVLKMLFHPGWSAGEQAKLTSNASGWVEVTDLRNSNLPLVIRWEGTVWQSRGEMLSLFGLVLVNAVILKQIWRRRRENQTQSVTFLDDSEEEIPSERSLANHWGLVGLMLFLVVGRYSLGWLTSFPFLYHSPPGRLAFAVEGQPTTLGDATTNQVALLGWELVSTAVPRPGDIVVVRLYWQPLAQISEALNSNVHLYTPSLKRSWAVESKGVYRAPSIVWSPEKYYVETMHLFVPIDAPPTTYSLVAGLVTSAGHRLAVPGVEDGLLPLRTIAVTPLRPGLFQRERPSISARAATTDNLRLQGYGLMPAHGGTTLRLFWETSGRVENNWVTYIHLHDPRGERIAQFDGPALAGLKPTSEWQPRALYIDRRHIALPAELQSGEYLLRIGLYDRDTGERLPFLHEADDQAHFEDGQLLVTLNVSAE